MLLTRNVKAIFNLNLFRDLVIVLKNYALEARLKSTFKKNASIACIRAHAWLDLCFFFKTNLPGAAVAISKRYQIIFPG